MMTIGVRMIIAIIVIIAQYSFAPHITMPLPALSLLAMLAAAWVLVRDFDTMLWWIVFIGVCGDLLSALPFGTTTMTLVVLAFFVDLIARRISFSQSLWRVIVLGVLIGCVSLGWIALYGALTQLDSALTMAQGIVYVVLSTIVFAGVYLCISRSEKFLTHYQNRVDIRRHF